MSAAKLKSSLLLLLAACIWGAAFVAQSKGMESMGPFSFNAARFLLGSAVLVPAAWSRIRKRRREGAVVERREIRTALAGGVFCGLALCAASTFQQIGLLYTSVGKAGFLTTLYIVLVPLFGLFLGGRVRPAVWGSVLLAAAGLYLLCVNGTLSLNRGDVLVFICAVLFSVHILVIDYFSPKADGVFLSCAQFFVSGLISLTAALIMEKPDLAGLYAAAWPVLYAGVMSCGVAYTLQIIGQKSLDPTVASLILSLESAVSVLAGWALLNQKLTRRETLGCAVVFAAVVLAQLPERADRGRAAGEPEKGGILYGNDQGNCGPARRQPDDRVKRYQRTYGENVGQDAGEDRSGAL